MTLSEKVDLAIKTIRFWEYKALEMDPVDGYYLGFSGGKDSAVIYELAKRAGVRFQGWYNVTTIDPPELVKHIRAHYPEVKWYRSGKGSLLRLIAKRGMPTRVARWCCKDYKEPGGAGLFKILGIRAAESPRRAAAWKTVSLWRGGGLVLNPILHWTDSDVWAFIRDCGLVYCTLYDEGFSRLGCVGCPMGGKVGKARDFARWPKLEAAWKHACHRLWEKRTGTMQRNGKPWAGDRFKTWKEFWDWWVSDDSWPSGDDCQMGWFL